MSIDKIETGDVLSKSKDLVEENIEKLKSLFPEITTEGKIDFKVLQEILGEEIEEEDEYYRLTWAGKSKARREAHKPSTGTLRPAKDESVDWDNTQNLYIEGDNLEVLKLMQKSYAGKIKIIYIDPPYNTGKDFVYKDDYKDNLKNYQEITGQVDEKGNRLSTNSESNGRFHSNWLNMMYPRLILARNLLTDDGVIFMSIDDGEVDNLIKLGNEIFGEENFLANIIWERAFSPVNLKKHFSENHDFIVSFAKNIENANCKGLKRSDKSSNNYKNPDNDERGPWGSGDLSVGPVIESKVYEIETPSGRKVKPPHGYCWRLTKERFEEFKEDNRIWFGEDGDNVPRLKRFLSEVKNTVTPMTIWKHKEVGHSQGAKQALKELFDNQSYFDYPKSIDLIQRIIELYSEKEDLILDFFSGSATTAEAVMDYNLSDDGNRKFIQVQLPEPIEEKSEAFKDGFKKLTDIGKERIRRAAKKIAKENPEKAKELDLGFKVFKLDSSNIKAWDGDPANLEQSLFEAQENIKTDRGDEDVMYEILLKYGLDLNLPIEEKEIAGQRVFNVGMGALFICLSDKISTQVAEGIGKWKEELQPATCRVIFKDSGFNDVEKTNCSQILKGYGIEEVKSI